MTTVATEAPGLDWTRNERNTCRTIRWDQWARETIDALRNKRGPYDGDHAADMLLKIAEYLDAQYDIGYEGIALTPRENFTLTFDH